MKSTLLLYKQIVGIRDFTQKLGAITSLTKGLASNVSELRQKYDTIKEVLEPLKSTSGKNLAPMDVTRIYKDSRQGTNIKILNQVVEDLMPSTFLTASPKFSNILSQVLDSMNIDSIGFNEDTIQDISLDLLSYITIKAYQKNQQDNDQQKVATLSNNILYPTDYESINSIVERMKTTEVGQNNFFLDNFALSLKANDISNQSGLNILEANTWRNLSPAQKVDLQTDFARLYGSLQTKNDALSILNYVMVKDGLQVKYASLFEAMSPFIMNNYLEQINSAELALRGQASFESVFGLTEEALTEEFKTGYLLSNNSGPKLFTFNRFLETGQLPKGLKLEDTKLSIDKKNFDPNQEPLYVRIGSENITTGVTIYKTYMLENSEGNSLTYTEVETMGSNQQTAIGFLFGDRPTYAKVREYVRKKNADPRDVSDNINIPEDQGIVVADQVLNMDNIDIEADENSVEANGINIANTAALLNILDMSQESEDRAEEEANNIENVDQSLPELDPVEEQLQLNFDEDITEQYPDISNF